MRPTGRTTYTTQTLNRMKRHINLLTIALASLLIVIGCSESANESTTSDLEVSKTTSEAVNGEEKTVATIGIEGMTCEIGCAKFIEGKLSNMDGVLTATVNFEEQKASVEFDPAKTNEKDMVAAISGLADGIYKVNSVAVEAFVKDAPAKKATNSEKANNGKKEDSRGASEKSHESVEAPVNIEFPNIFDAFRNLL